MNATAAFKSSPEWIKSLNAIKSWASFSLASFQNHLCVLFLSFLYLFLIFLLHLRLVLLLFFLSLSLSLSLLPSRQRNWNRRVISEYKSNELTLVTSQLDPRIALTTKRLNERRPLYGAAHFPPRRNLSNKTIELNNIKYHRQQMSFLKSINQMR